MRNQSSDPTAKRKEYFAARNVAIRDRRLAYIRSPARVAAQRLWYPKYYAAQKEAIRLARVLRRRFIGAPCPLWYARVLLANQPAKKRVY